MKRTAFYTFSTHVSMITCYVQFVKVDNSVRHFVFLSELFPVVLWSFREEIHFATVLLTYKNLFD